jgi:hypothetical protein
MLATIKGTDRHLKIFVGDQGNDVATDPALFKQNGESDEHHRQHPDKETASGGQDIVDDFTKLQFAKD